jgi:hypothetical protein
MKAGIFQVLLLTGRPASGKSEIIDYLLRLTARERRDRFHLGEVQIFDDFPILWAWFEEDALLRTKFNLPALHSDERGYFLQKQYWHLLIERLGMDYQKVLRDTPDYHKSHTALVEFSRGKEHGGYREAFAHLSLEILGRASILYVNVSFSESLRKNRLRFNPKRPDSILEHGLPDEKMEILYKEDDWAELTREAGGTIPVDGYQVPYAVFENQEDVTTGKPELLASRLESVLGKLWKLQQTR